MISSPISSRNHPTGTPEGVELFGDELNKKQKSILAKLAMYDDRYVFTKRDVDIRDIAAITAATGDEFAVFTKGGERLVIRGGKRHVNVDEKKAEELKSQGYKWSWHTHPGSSPGIAVASKGDRLILEAFEQDHSVIISSTGRRYVFGRKSHEDIGFIEGNGN